MELRTIEKREYRLQQKKEAFNQYVQCINFTQDSKASLQAIMKECEEYSALKEKIEEISNLLSQFDNKKEKIIELKRRRMSKLDKLKKLKFRLNNYLQDINNIEFYQERLTNKINRALEVAEDKECSEFNSLNETIKEISKKAAKFVDEGRNILESINKDINKTRS